MDNARFVQTRSPKTIYIPFKWEASNLFFNKSINIGREWIYFWCFFFIQVILSDRTRRNRFFAWWRNPISLGFPFNFPHREPPSRPPPTLIAYATEGSLINNSIKPDRERQLTRGRDRPGVRVHASPPPNSHYHPLTMNHPIWSFHFHKPLPY